MAMGLLSPTIDLLVISVEVLGELLLMGSHGV